ncbi:hypothetical protein HBH56_002190 [Parastagonospora nodorum]|nr:hypothetical protein HBH56_002190 [Parastagonospora nodorum]KAH4164371.1 hypothetical protein HBH44_074170 [Parastagonospora nodorum]KAH4569744.1 hypothetical protein HBH84_119900 [Parastagonospora nodorum]
MEVQCDSFVHCQVITKEIQQHQSNTKLTHGGLIKLSRRPYDDVCFSASNLNLCFNVINAIVSSSVLL